MSVNNAVLGVVFISVVVGLSMNKLGLGKESVIYRFCEEVSKIVVTFLSFTVRKFGPAAIFMLLCRTFATYGIDYLKPALAYCMLTVAILLAYLFIGYPLYISLICKLNPYIFIKKIFKVLVFGFSTSSSAATLPLNLDTTNKELGVDRQIASFVLPLGMTINMDGTAIMQVVATLFIAGCGGYDVTVAVGDHHGSGTDCLHGHSCCPRCRCCYPVYHLVRCWIYRRSGIDCLHLDPGNQPSH